MENEFQPSNDYPVNNDYNNNNYNNNNNRQQQIPNGTTVLVLGICSIVLTCFLVGLILGIIGLVLGNKSRKLYAQNPGQYEGYGTLNAGWIMSIIGVCLGGLYWMYFMFYIIIVGGTLATIFANAA
jgi:hypothetical protein